MTTPTQQQDVQCLLRDHIQLLVKSYAIIAHDRSKEDMVIELKAMISGSLDLVNDPDVADSVRSFMIDIANAIAIYRQRLIDEGPDSEPVGIYDSHAAGVSNTPSVPREVAELMDRFDAVFKPELYPVQASNRPQFTNAEDQLLALGLRKFGTNWHAIRANMLPAKSESEIENRARAGAAENSNTHQFQSSGNDF